MRVCGIAAAEIILWRAISIDLISKRNVSYGSLRGARRRACFESWRDFISKCGECGAAIAFRGGAPYVATAHGDGVRLARKLNGARRAANNLS